MRETKKLAFDLVEAGLGVASIRSGLKLQCYYQVKNPAASSNCPVSFQIIAPFLARFQVSVVKAFETHLAEI